MFYVRKPIKADPMPLIRTATPLELYNYKNRFIVKPPIDNPEQEETAGCDCDCGCSHNLDELLFININCDLDLYNLGSKE
jgi:hypothetical protein